MTNNTSKQTANTVSQTATLIIRVNAFMILSLIVLMALAYLSIQYDSWQFDKCDQNRTSLRHLARQANDHLAF